MNENEPRQDPTVWREVYSTNAGDFYADTIAFSDCGSIRLCAGGRVCIQPSIRAMLDALWPDPDPDAVETRLTKVEEWVAAKDSYIGQKTQP